MDDNRRIVQLIESLGHELAEFRTQVVARFDGVDERLDILSSRLDRQAGLIQSGSRMTVRQNAWNERVDQTPPCDFSQARTSLSMRTETGVFSGR